MSFSYKTLNSNDITLTSYIANKQWEVSGSTFSQNGVTIYVGENLPITRDNPFDPIDDTQTSNEEYRRLVFDSIKHLYYENYVSKSLTGQFFQSSSYFNYEQSTLVSGTIRNLTTITGSNLNPNQLALYDSPSSQSLFDKVSTLYDVDDLDPDAGSRVVIISIDKSIYGSGLSPKSVNISGSTYNIQDDGEGNLLDTLATSSLYIGNVFYSQGLIVITNQNYLCILGIPPTAVNDYFSYNNTTPLSTLDILGNDFTDCGYVDYTSFISTGGNFPNYTQNNGLITITPNQTSVIPGNYQLGYTIASTTGVRSNTGSINLTITSQPLEIQVNTTGLTCWGTSSLVPVTCSINYGIPYYSWSFDGGASYTSSNSLTGITVSGSVLSSANNTFYVKDYTGTVYSSSFTTWYPAIAPNVGYPFYTTPLCSSTASNGIIYIKRGTATQASVNGGAFTNLSKFDPGTAFTNATTASTIIYKNAYGCTTSSIFNMDYLPQVTVNFTTSSATCYGGTNGTATFTFSNAVTNNYYDFIKNGVYVVQAYLVSPSASVTFTNLEPTSSYELELFSDTSACASQGYYKVFTVGQPTEITFVATASYIDSCSNAVIFNATGGTPPYTYFAVDTGSGVTYSSNSSSVSLTNLSGSVYSLSVLDNNGCTSSSSLLTVFGRQFSYTGSVCSGSAGYVSSSGVQQTFNSGPYSGSLVTSSYSSGSILIGPTVDFKRLFVSGTLDNIFPCPGGILYTRISYDPVLCPPGGCAIPVLTSATVTSCASYDYNYNISYNSSSTGAIYTFIQYSTDLTFTSNVTASRITNSSPLILPINISNLPSPPSSQYTPVYFRAYNSCSGLLVTSSFSNILSADCIEPPPPAYEPFTVQIKNFSGNTIKYKNLGGSVISVANNRSSSFNFSEETTSTQIAIQGVSGIQDPNPNGYYDYSINISSSAAVDCNVATTVSPLLENSYFTPTTVNCGYTSGGTYTFFDSDGSALTYDAQVDIDRGTYTPGGTITLSIRPSFFIYDF